MSPSTLQSAVPPGGLVAQIEKWRAEHGRLREWLARLDRCEANVPLHVLHAVRRDYAARLETLLEEINTGATAVRTSITAATDRAAGAVDAIAEARLRHVIGELDATAVATRIAGQEAEIAAAAEDKKMLQRSLVAIQEFLSELENAPATEQSIPTASRPAPPTPPPARDTAHMFAEWEAPTPEPAAPAEDQANADELAFLQSLPASPSPPAPPPAPNGVVSFETLKNHPRGQRAGSSGAAAPLVTAQAAVRCRKCGLSNDPRLWYCDGCGAELA